MKKYIIILLIIALSGFSTLRITAGTLSFQTDDNLLKLLHERIVNAKDTSEEYKLIHQLQEAAIKQESPIYEGLSYYYFLRYYRYNLRENEALIWAQRLDTLSRAHKFHYLLFEGRKLLVELYGINGDFGQALNEAKEMNEEAGRLECSLCPIIAKNSLATVYMAAGQYKEADKLLLATEQERPKEEQSFSSRQTQLLLLIQTSLNLNELDRTFSYLTQLRQLMEQKGPNGTTFFSEKMNSFTIRFRYYSCYASYHLLNKEPNLALKYLEKMREMTDTTSAISYQVLLYKKYADYYLVVHQYELALKNLDKVLGLLQHSSGHYQAALREKAELLSLNGQHKEAYDTYEDLVLLQDTVEQNRYIRQINLFKMRYKVEQNELINEQLHLKSESLYLLTLFLCLFCILLTALIYTNHRMRKKLQQAKDKSERSGLLKSAFLANMNHEIRTPLNAVAGFSELLAEETDMETRIQYGAIIKENNTLLINLLSDVMDISKIESDTMDFSYSTVYLPSLLNDLYKTTRLQMPESIELIKGSTPEVTIHADRTRLIQIFNNLLSNAIKHTSEGQIRFGYEYEKPDRIRFYVTDTGEGISEELQKMLFVRFVQAVETHTKGVGLGLALCKGFVNQMGGDIGVESKEGSGSTFWFTLPCNEV